MKLENSNKFWTEEPSLRIITQIWWNSEKFTRMNIFFLFAGLFVGALIRYAATNTTATHLNVSPTSNNQTPTYNQSLPPDTLWLMVIKYHPFWMYYIKCFVYFHLKSLCFLSNPSHGCDITLNNMFHQWPSISDNVTYV